MQNLDYAPEQIGSGRIREFESFCLLERSYSYYLLLTSLKLLYLLDFEQCHGVKDNGCSNYHDY